MLFIVSAMVSWTRTTQMIFFRQRLMKSSYLIEKGNYTCIFIMIRIPHLRKIPQVGLVQGDPLRSLKLQILQVANFQDEQEFPLYLDRFPTQVCIGLYVLTQFLSCMCSAYVEGNIAFFNVNIRNIKQNCKRFSKIVLR